MSLNYRKDLLMKRLVRFDGMTTKCYGCTDPKHLVIGKIYEVITVTNLGWQLNYHLKGETGEYNSKWFTLVEREEKKNIT